MFDPEPVSAAAFPLHAAAERGDLDRLNTLLVDGVAVDAPDPYGRTPMMYAIHGGQMEVLRHLLKWGASVAQQSHKGALALQFAAREGNEEAVRLLLARGAKPNQIVTIEPEKPISKPAAKAWRKIATLFPIGSAEEKAELDSILSRTPKTPERKHSGPAHLMAALCGNNLAIAQMLFETGLDAMPSEPERETAKRQGDYMRERASRNPLPYAARHCSPEIVRLLAERGFPISPNDHGLGSALSGALSLDCLDNARVLLEMGADPNEGMLPPLSSAIFNDNLDAAKLLLSFGASLDIRGVSHRVHGCSPAFQELFAQHRRSEWHRFVHSDDCDSVRAALEAGADVNVRVEDGNTALILATRQGDLPMANLLLEHGANIDLANTFGQTPLHHSIMQDQVPMARWLIERGANVDAITASGQTPLSMAWEDGRSDLRILLRESGAKVDLSTAMLIGDTSRVIQMLEVGNPVDSPAPSGMTAFLSAVRRADWQMAATLHEQWGANVKARDKRGRTAIHLVIRKTSGPLSVEDTRIEAIDQLLAWGAQLDDEDDTGCAALETAAQVELPAIVAALLQRGADPNRQRGSLKHTVLHDRISLLFLREEDDPIVPILIDRGADVNVSDAHGSTALAALLNSAPRAMQKPDAKTAEIQSRTRTVLRLLLDAGADLRQETMRFDLVDTAVRINDVEIVRLLLDRGAKMKHRGWRALQMAKSSGNAEIVALLRERGASEKVPAGRDFSAEWEASSLPLKDAGRVLMEKIRAEQAKPWIAAESPA